MKNKALRSVGNSAGTAACADSAKEYLEFELDDATLARVTALAEESHCTPFTFCLGLLEESMALRAPQS